MQNKNIQESALAKALGDVVAELRRQWEREKELILSETRQAVSDLRATMLESTVDFKEKLQTEAKAHREALEASFASTQATLLEKAETASTCLQSSFNAHFAELSEKASAQDSAISEILAKIKDDNEAHRQAIGQAVDESQATLLKTIEEASLVLEKRFNDWSKSYVPPVVEPPPAPEPVLDWPKINDLIAGEVRKAVEALPKPQPGKDGIGVAGGMINQDGHLLFTLSNGQVHDAGRVKGADSTPGRDGVGYDDLEAFMEDGGRTLVHRYKVKGEVVKELRFQTALVVDRGVFKSGQTYQPGDGVTWGGSFWIAQAETTSERPGEGESWRLAVKKGRDAKGS